MTKEDDGGRWLDVLQAKHRFVTRADGILFEAVQTETSGFDILGRAKTISLLHCHPEIVEKGGREVIQQAAKQAKDEEREAMGRMIRADRKKRVVVILDALEFGEYKTMSEINDALGGKKELNVNLVTKMVEGGEIEQFVPKNKRDSHHTKCFRLAVKAADEYDNLSNGR
jgi:hypothetical protein